MGQHCTFGRIIEKPNSHCITADSKDEHLTGVSKTQMTISRAGRLIKAIQEVGRLFQTLYILEYIDNPQLRGEVRLHLSRHETKNTLARYLFFGEEGELRRRDYESQMERISCLSLLINCIVTWNTHYLSLAIQQLLKEGNKINDELITHISPLMHAHINPYGVYYFNIS